MRTLNLRLIFCSFFLFFCGFSVVALAEESMKAVPPVAVEEAPLEETGKPPVFVELFSSQACVFCPQADRLFGDLLQQPHVMGVSCHVDYFKVREGSLSHPFCTERQNWYMKALKAGPNYTPQMVINGHRDVVGYKMDDVVESLQKAEQDRFFMLNVVPGDEEGVYSFMLPETTMAEGQSARIWLAVYDRPHDISIADGRNRGKPMQYVHIVSAMKDLGLWNGKAMNRNVIPVAGEKQKGFVVLAQDVDKGAILAMGLYELPEKKVERATHFGPNKP